MRIMANAVDMHSNYNQYISNQRNNMHNSVEGATKGEFYERLKTWTKGENGESKLVSLKDVPTGAIYLASNEAKDRLIDTEKLNKDGSVTLKNNFNMPSKHIDVLL